MTADRPKNFRDLPELPHRPHRFFHLDRQTVSVTIPGRSEPVNLSVVSAGEGPPLLLVHGLMTTAYSWRYVIDDLAKQYRVLVVDLPGAGQSDAPGDLAQDPQTLALLLDGLLETLGIPKAYVVGNSMGGYISLWWSLLKPERFERLMVMHAPGFPEPRLYLLQFLLSIPGNRALLALVTRNHEQFALTNVHYHDESLKSREETREYARWTSEPARRELFRRNLKETMSPSTMSLLPAKLAARSPGVPPVRLLWSRHDPLVSPLFGPRYQALIPGAELVWIDDSSHFLQVDSPEATVREILRFGAAGER